MVKLGSFFLIEVFSSLFLALLSIDLSIKWYLNTASIESITLIPYFLDYFLTKNTGIALSLFSSSGSFTQILLLIFIFLALVFLTYTFLNRRQITKARFVIDSGRWFWKFYRKIFLWFGNRLSDNKNRN